MAYPTSSYSYKGVEVTMTWIRDNDMEKFTPITQVYAIIFNKKGEILVAREAEDGKWQIPGGKPEEGEDYKKAITRELLEEVDVQAGEIYPLGAQKTEMPGNPNKDEGDLFYQLRCVVELGELLPQTPDPDRGNTWQRKFVPSDEIKQYIKWGEVGDAMFDDAVALWNELHPTL